jgi:uncharacterized BrkB/YihY/UPF0761 family membrane protein
MDQPSSPAPEPSRWTRWLGFVCKVSKAIDRDHLPIAAAGVAFFLMLGIFPGLAALFSIYGWLSDPLEIERQLQAESGVLPHEVHQILLSQVRMVASDNKTAGLGTVLSLLFAVWAGSYAMSLQTIRETQIHQPADRFARSNCFTAPRYLFSHFPHRNHSSLRSHASRR